MLTQDFQDTISNGFDSYGENVPDTKLSTLDGLGSYEEFQLSLKQMEEHYSESHFDQDDQEIHRLSRTTFGDYGQNVDTTSTQYESHHHDLNMKILPGLTIFPMLPQPLHQDDCGMKSPSPPISYGYSSGQTVDTATVQHDAQIQDNSSADVFEKHSIREENSGNPIAKPFLQVSPGSELASSTLQAQDYDTPMEPPCQEDFQRVQPLGNQENGASYNNFVDELEAPPSMNAEGDIHQSGVDHSDAVPCGPQEESVAVSNVQHGSNLASKSRNKRSRHTQEDLLILRNYYDNYLADSSRNPTFSECLALSYETNLDFKQVGTWFSNEKERRREKVKETGDSEDIISTNRKRHSDFQINLLKAWVAKNEPNDPAPSTKERKELARETGLSLEQVSGWFMNLRKNRKKAARSSQ